MVKQKGSERVSFSIAILMQNNNQNKENSSQLTVSVL